jgi:hypothetical protein
MSHVVAHYLFIHWTNELIPITVLEVIFWIGGKVHANWNLKMGMNELKYHQMVDPQTFLGLHGLGNRLR